MIDLSKHIIQAGDTIYKAFEQLNKVPKNLTLFVLGKNNEMTGTLTDGDIRRGFLKGLTLSDKVADFMNPKFSYLIFGNYNLKEIRSIKERGVKLLPILDKDKKIIKVLDFSMVNTILPVDVVLMAGGRGERLRPLTDNMPKPMLKVADKPIIEHNIDRLIRYGVENFVITLRYLGEKIEDYFKDGSQKGVHINYVREKDPLGTIGAVNLIRDFKNEHVLVMNSDLFTNIDYEDFFHWYTESNADLCIATIPYHVDVPYAILSITDQTHVNGLEEKPRYTYYANAGIYLFKSKLVKLMDEKSRMDATDFIKLLIDSGYKVEKYPIIGYWIDIGKPDDFVKANEFAKHTKD